MERFETSDRDVSATNGNTKCPVEKTSFAENLQLKLFCVTVANADTESLKSAGEILTKSYGPKCTKF